MTDKKDWYNNKELYEMIQGLKDDLQETRIVIKRYNGLRKDLGETMKKVEAIEQQEKGKKQAGISIREWTAWAVAILSLFVTILVATGVIG